MSLLKRLLKPLVHPIALPQLSLVIVIYDMPQQAEKTILSLSNHYQRGVSEQDYEVIVVENSSSNELGKTAAQRFGGNIHYFRREEHRPSPVPAAHFGAGKAKGEDRWSPIGTLVALRHIRGGPRNLNSAISGFSA